MTAMVCAARGTWWPPVSSANVTPNAGGPSASAGAPPTSGGGGSLTLQGPSNGCHKVAVPGLPVFNAYLAGHTVTNPTCILFVMPGGHYNGWAIGDPWLLTALNTAGVSVYTVVFNSSFTQSWGDRAWPGPGGSPNSAVTPKLSFRQLAAIPASLIRYIYDTYAVPAGSPGVPFRVFGGSAGSGAVATAMAAPYGLHSIVDRVIFSAGISSTRIWRLCSGLDADTSYGPPSCFVEDCAPIDTAMGYQSPTPGTGIYQVGHGYGPAWLADYGNVANPQTTRYFPGTGQSAPANGVPFGGDWRADSVEYGDHRWLTPNPRHPNGRGVDIRFVWGGNDGSNLPHNAQAWLGPLLGPNGAPQAPLDGGPYMPFGGTVGHSATEPTLRYQVCASAQHTLSEFYDGGAENDTGTTALVSAITGTPSMMQLAFATSGTSSVTSIQGPIPGGSPASDTVTLSATIPTGSPVTSMPVNPIPMNMVSGQALFFAGGRDVWVLTAAASAGSTSLSVKYYDASGAVTWTPGGNDHNGGAAWPAGTAITICKQPVMPCPGNLLVAVHQTLSSATSTAPPGWTAGPTVSTTSSGFVLSTWWKVATGQETAADFAFTSSASVRQTLSWIELGNHLANPALTLAAQNAGTGTALSVSSPGTPTSYPQIALFIAETAAATVSGVNAAWTPLVIPTSGLYIGYAVVAAGAVPAGSLTMSGSSQWAGVILAFAGGPDAGS